MQSREMQQRVLKLVGRGLHKHIAREKHVEGATHEPRAHASGCMGRLGLNFVGHLHHTDAARKRTQALSAYGLSFLGPAVTRLLLSCVGVSTGADRMVLARLLAAAVERHAVLPVTQAQVSFLSIPFSLPDYGCVL